MSSLSREGWVPGCHRFACPSEGTVVPRPVSFAGKWVAARSNRLQENYSVCRLECLVERGLKTAGIARLLAGDGCKPLSVGFVPHRPTGLTPRDVLRRRHQRDRDICPAHRSYRCRSDPTRLRDEPDSLHSADTARAVADRLALLSPHLSSRRTEGRITAHGTKILLDGSKGSPRTSIVLDGNETPTHRGGIRGIIRHRGTGQKLLDTRGCMEPADRPHFANIGRAAIMRAKRIGLRKMALGGGLLLSGRGFLRAEERRERLQFLSFLVGHCGTIRSSSNKALSHTTSVPVSFRMTGSHAGSCPPRR